MNYWEGGEWLDGPKLFAWLKPLTVPDELAYAKSGGVRKGYVNDSLRRRLDRWSVPGVRVALIHLEPYLAEMGIHPGELDDDLWLEQPTPPPDLCRNGHDLSVPGNARISARGRRTCCTCERATQRKKRLRKGQVPLVPAEPLAAYLRALRAELGSWNAVAEAVNLPVSSVSRLVRGERRRVAQPTLERILLATTVHDPNPSESAGSLGK